MSLEPSNMEIPSKWTCRIQQIRTSEVPWNRARLAKPLVLDSGDDFPVDSPWSVVQLQEVIIQWNPNGFDPTSRVKRAMVPCVKTWVPLMENYTTNPHLNGVFSTVFHGKRTISTWFPHDFHGWGRMTAVHGAASTWRSSTVEAPWNHHEIPLFAIYLPSKMGMACFFSFHSMPWKYNHSEFCH